MIHLLGTAHSAQVWSDAKRNGVSLDADKEMMMKFEKFLEAVARVHEASAIAEEASEEWVLAHGPGVSSVAKDVSERLGIRHLFCDPNTEERRAIGLKVGPEMMDHATKIAVQTGRDFVEVYRQEIRKGFVLREGIWIDRLEKFDPNKAPLIFVCGADHVDTFGAALESKHTRTSVHCRDWTELLKD